MWKERRQSEVAESTYGGYHTYIDRHLIPYFRDLDLNIQDITAGHIFDYINYLSQDGGRKDKKIGSQAATSVRKIVSILRRVFDYTVLYAHISHRRKVSLARDLDNGEQKGEYLPQAMYSPFIIRLKCHYNDPLHAE